MSAAPTPPAGPSEPNYDDAGFPRLAAASIPDTRPETPTSRGGGWIRVSSKLRCPVCGKHDWCGVAADGSAAACMRVEVGSVRRLKNGAWLHRFGTNDRDPRRPSGGGTALPLPPTSPPADAVADAAKLNRLMDRYRRAVTPAQRGKLAAQLGLSSPQPLVDLGVGWSSYHPGYAFPCRDPLSRLVGIQIRGEDGTKRLVRGSRQGLFLPWDLRTMSSSTPLVICEGASDTACCLDLAYQQLRGLFLSDLPWRPVGRPNWACGGDLLEQLVLDLHPDRHVDVIVIADNEAAGDGRRGARELVEQLRSCVRRIDLLVPEAKDLRERVRDGLTAAVFSRAIRG
jgi:hypothetical protein